MKGEKGGGGVSFIYGPCAELAIPHFGTFRTPNVNVSPKKLVFKGKYRKFRTLIPALFGT